MLRSTVAAILLLLCGTSAWSDEYVQMTGEELYRRFCASCHGAQGRGDGPVAASFKVEVPDLTLLARRAGGTFPRERVVRIIDGRHIFAAHGSRTMPVCTRFLKYCDERPERARTQRTSEQRRKTGQDEQDEQSRRTG